MIGRDNREELLQTLAHTHRTGTRTAATVRRRERLVQVDVHHIESHVTRTADTQHRIEVGTVVVHQSAAVVNQFRNLRDTGLEESQRVGVGHHHRGDVVFF